MVVDGVVGDFLCARFGMLTDTPLTLEIKANRLVSAESANKELEDAFWAYTHTDENSDRVGEFAIGTNIELTRLIGNILQDEKFPGIHIAFGNPYGVHTGADWYSTHPHRRRRHRVRHLGRRHPADAARDLPGLGLGVSRTSWCRRCASASTASGRRRTTSGCSSG